MIVLIVILAAVVLLALPVLWTVRGLSLEPQTIDTASLATEPTALDIAAFRNLVDPTEEEFLRINLTRQLFRTIQRQRLRAAVEYVQCAAVQARVLVRLADATRDERTGELPHISEELVAAAIRLRALSLLVLLSLYVRIVFPELRMPVIEMPAMYEHVVGLGQLAGVKRAARAGMLRAAG
jgi:hypothetical protein